MPDAKRDSQPQRKEGKGDEQCGRFEAHENPTRSGRVDVQSERASDHGSGFNGGVDFAVVDDGKSKGCKRDGWRCAEETCEALRAEDIAEYGEETDDCATDQKTKKEIRHGYSYREALKAVVNAISGGSLSLLD